MNLSNENDPMSLLAYFGKGMSTWLHMVGVLGFVSIILVVILLLWHQGVWDRFAERRKWMSRIALFILMFVFFAPLMFVSLNISQAIPRGIDPEFPTLTSTAIKLALYGVYLGHELKPQLSVGGDKVFDCVLKISTVEAKARQDKCGDNRACFEKVPVMTRAEIVAKIKESQSAGNPDVSKACKGVDVAKL